MKLRWTTGWIALLTAGCGGVLHRVDKEPPAAVETPESFVNRPGDPSTEAPFDGRWWLRFQAEDLNRVVEAALDDNLDLAQVYARLEQAEYLRKGAFAGFFPSVGYTAQYSGTRSLFGFAQGGAFEFGTFDAGGTLSYEVDLWGRVAHGHAAAAAEMRAATADAETAVLSVAANVAEVYFRVVEARAALELLQRQLEASETFLELTELRFDKALASGLDVFQQREQVASTRSLFPPVRATLAVSEHQLAVLLGQPPGSVRVNRDALPDLPPFPELGLPSTVLLQRPDVRAARERVVAQDHRIGTAIAQFYPRFALNASVGVRSFNGFEDLFDDFVWNIVGSLTGPIFQGGRLRAEVNRNRAALKERVAGFTQVVLVALREVEDALAQEREQKALIEDLDRQEEAARNTLKEAQLRYSNGLSDYLPVLTALTSLQNTQRQALLAQRELLSRRIQLHRALGGTWAEAELPGSEEAEGETPAGDNES